MEKQQVTSGSPIFATFGSGFQSKVLQALIIDRVWATQFIEVFHVDECLDQAYLKLIANKYINYYKEYKEFPSIDLLVTILRDGLSSDKDMVLKEQCSVFLKKLNENNDLGDLPWVKEKALEFCRQQLMKKALNKCVDVILTDKYETVVGIMKEAISTGTATNVGLDYNNDIETRYSETYRKCVRTGITELDDRKLLNGGLGAGEIGIIVSPTGVGKSHQLVHFGAQCMLQGKNVFYYTMELSERYVGIRFDSHLTDIPSLECFDAKEAVKAYFEENREKLGRLIIKEFPPRTVTVNTLKAHIEKMSFQGVRPDLIIVDYAGLLRSTERYELPRMEMQLVVQELRKFAKEMDVPLWTALQSNKEGAKADIVDVTNMAESYGQAAESDFVLGLQRPSTQKSTGYGTLFIAKNRFGIDGLTYKIHLDTSRSKLKILTENEIEGLQVSIEDTQQRMKQETLQSFQEILRRKKEQFTKLGPSII